MPVRLLLTVVTGFGTGVLSGMFGVGGAVVSTPAIRALGATPLQAVGSTLPSILPSAVSGSLRYRREGLIRGRVVTWTGTAGVGGSVGGALVAPHVPGNGHLLMLATAALLAFTALRTAVSPDRPDPADAEPAEDEPPRGVGDGGDGPRDEWWRLAVIGIGAGGLSGLLGIGGGLVMVPAFTGWVRLPIKEAIGSSLACVGILAVPGTITHQVLGNIAWLYAAPLSVAVIPGARLGAHLAIRSSDRALRLTVAAVLGAIALVYATGELWSLLH